MKENHSEILFLILQIKKIQNFSVYDEKKESREPIKLEAGEEKQTDNEISKAS